MNAQLLRALEYIRNAGSSPAIAHFDEDHEPVGPRIRAHLKDAKLTHEDRGRIMLCTDSENVEARGAGRKET